MRGNENCLTAPKLRRVNVIPQRILLCDLVRTDKTGVRSTG